MGHSYCKDDTIFGLLPSDLTTEQLNKVHVSKLAHFLGQDDRIEDVMVGNLDIENISILSDVPSKVTDKIPKVIARYNEIIQIHASRIEEESNKEYYYSNRRSHFIYFNLLNAENKRNEYDRWSKGHKSVIIDAKVDIKWLFEKYPDIADQYTKRTFDRRFTVYNYVPNDVMKIIPALPKKYLDKYLPQITESGGSIVQPYLLSNPNISEEHMISGFRALAGRKRVPRINVKVKKSILEKLPPVMRLNLLETLLVYSCSRVEFEDIKTTEDLESLLFTTSIGYNDRVNQVVRIFKRNIERNRS